jgi:hypothetical protein
MSKLLATMLSLTTVIALSGTAGLAQTSCPPEVASAKAMLTQTAKSQEIEAPRSLAGARTQDIQAPRTQELQAPRTQELQAPRTQELQAPRTQELQAPRTQELQAPRTQELQAPRSANFTQASGLVTEAEAACKAGNSSLATSKAKAAMDLLK